MSWPLIAVVVIVTGVILYWLLIATEGTYLGAHVVAILYNWVAGRYDTMKRFDPRMEEIFLVRPMLSALQGRPDPLVLDVATGTGRVPALLLAEPDFSGRVVGLDFAREMLAVAAGKTAGHGSRITYIWQNAMRLPFPDTCFDLVTCLEALEFMPHPEQVLREIVRVARPGSLVFVTHRRGWERMVMPGKSWSESDFRSLLEGVGLGEINLAPWQKDYSLAWGRTGGGPFKTAEGQSGEYLTCLGCQRRSLTRDGAGLRCLNCDSHYAIAADGIIEMGATRLPRRRQ